MSKRPITTENVLIARVPFFVVVSPHYMQDGRSTFSFYPEDLTRGKQAFVIEQTLNGFRVLPHPVRGEPIFTIENQVELFKACSKLLERHNATKERRRYDRSLMRGAFDFLRRSVKAVNNEQR